MTDRLKGKIAFITGAGGGIGTASALAFAREGAAVVVAEIDTARGQQTTRLITESGGRAVFVPVDVTKPESVKAALKTGEDSLGPINVLYNNAGYSMEADRGVAAVSEEVWQETFSVVLYGTFLCAKYGIPRLLKNGGGCVINTASVVGVTGAKGQNAYATAKGGVIALTRNIALQYADRNIRANVLLPGLTLSPRLEQRLKAYPKSAERIKARHPFGACQPEDIANAAVFLASDESRMITGQALAVDGGFLLGSAPAL